MSTSSLHDTARITANDIPDDIWRLIAEELLRSLGRVKLPSVYMSVNRTFFDYFLVQQYGEIEWVQLDQKMITVLNHLQHPVIAQRVRKLSIRAWFIQFLLKREKLFHRKPSKASQLLSLFSKKPSRTELQTLGSLQNNPPTKQGKLADTISSKDIIRSMIIAVQNMSKVTTLHFEWRDLPLNKDTMTFLFSTREAFDKSLRSLVLRAEFPKFKEILAITNFENIFEVDFTFDYSPDPDGDTINDPKSGSTIGQKGKGKGKERRSENSQMKWNETVVPFLEYRKSTLRSLALASECQFLDLSDLLDELPQMTSLRNFELQIPASTTALSRPASVVNFLKCHSSLLNSVRLLPVNPPRQYQPSLPPFDTSSLVLPAPATQVNSVAEAINEHLLTEPLALTGLDSLEIPYVSLDATLPLLRRSSETLERLTLVGCPMAHDDVPTLAGVFSHRPYGIVHLRMNIKFIDLPLISSLATGFPGLRSLVLICMDDRWNTRRLSMGTESDNSERTAARGTLDGMGSRRNLFVLQWYNSVERCFLLCELL
ncbi:hypothetical protein BJ165DRAFT_1407487 [Panaeolus papilionaceus]|nr:hypothetical protein BJ165DRAFT_1407487 [Panaeolus papilionaceus]